MSCNNVFDVAIFCVLHLLICFAENVFKDVHYVAPQDAIFSLLCNEFSQIDTQIKMSEK